MKKLSQEMEYIKHKIKADQEDLDDCSDEEIDKRHFILKKKKTEMQFTELEFETQLLDDEAFAWSFLAMLIWQFGGAAFYSLWYDWPYATGFYYSTQAGLSIGFGSLAEDNDWTRFYTICHVLAGSSIIVGALGLFSSSIIDSSVNFDPNAKVVPQSTFQKYAHSPVSWFIVWIFMGTCYGRFHEGWSFIHSLYFAITALSTAGLQGPTAELSENTFSMFFMGFWTLTGVPVFGMALGSLANVLVADYLEKKMDRKLKKTVSNSEIEYMMKLNGIAEGANCVDFGEFLQFSLMKLGLLDDGMVQRVKNQFSIMDSDGNGMLTADEMHCGQEFMEVDVTRDGVLNETEVGKLLRDKVETMAFEYNLPELRRERVIKRIYEDILTVSEQNPDAKGVGVTLKQYMGVYKFFTKESEQTSIFFREHMNEWLNRKLVLPLKSVHKRQKRKKKKKKKLNSTLLRNESTILHYLKWTQTEEGQAFLQENSPQTVIEGKVNLPLSSHTPISENELIMSEYLKGKIKPSRISTEKTLNMNSTLHSETESQQVINPDLVELTNASSDTYKSNDHDV